MDGPPETVEIEVFNAPSKNPSWSSPLSENVALKGKATALKEGKDVWPSGSNRQAKAVNDGEANLRNYWQADGRALTLYKDIWVQVELLQQTIIDRIEIDWAHLIPEEFAIELSDDGRAWYKIHHARNYNNKNFTTTAILNNNPSHQLTAKFVRMLSLKTNRWSPWGPTIYELRVFGNPSSASAIKNRTREMKQRFLLDGRPNQTAAKFDVIGRIDPLAGN